MSQLKNEVDLSFCIWEFEDVSPDEISVLLGIKPFKTYLKGERKNPNFKGLSKQNGWILKPSTKKFSSFEDQLHSLLDILELKAELIKPICERYYCEFSCAVFVYYGNGQSLPSIHLDSRYNKFVKNLNIEFDIDFYCLPNE